MKIGDRVIVKENLEKELLNLKTENYEYLILRLR